MLRIASIIGGRPHPIKAAPIHAALEETPGMRHVLVDLGYLDKLYAHDTYAQLGLPAPVARFPEPPSDSRKAAFSALVSQASEAFASVAPDHVLIYGDLDSSFAAAVAAKAEGIPTTHVEAGLRSHDYRDHEEANRLAIDRLADLYVTHDVAAVEQLSDETSLHDEVLLTASPAIESLFNHLSDARDDALRAHGLEEGSYCLATVHRPEALAHPKRFQQIIVALTSIAATVPVVLLNYRSTAALISETFSGIDTALTVLPTLSYFDYLGLLKGAGLVVTDSSGLQDEAMALGIPCVVARPSTHRVEATPNSLIVAGTSTGSIIEAALDRIGAGRSTDHGSRLWDRPAGKDIADFLKLHLQG